MKILLQRVWEERVSWDDPVPEKIQHIWHQWRSELQSVTHHSIPRCYFPKHAHVTSYQIHGFCDASEHAYAGVIYLRMVDQSDAVYTSLVMSKSKVSPINRLSIPRWELCGTVVLTKLVHHVRQLFQIPLSSAYTWTDSTIVLSWLQGNPRKFKTYVGNRISEIVDLVPPERWNHVVSADNPADCASRGILPSQLLDHQLWWTGPPWLVLNASQWPQRKCNSVELPAEEEREVCLVSVSPTVEPVIPLERFSSFTRLQRIVAWILRFVAKCRPSMMAPSAAPNLCLSVPELAAAEKYLIKYSHINSLL